MSAEKFTGGENAHDADDSISKAQEIARENGLRIGQVVAHPSSAGVYRLEKIEGEKAIVSKYEGREEVRLELPLRELYDPRVAKIVKDRGLILEDERDENLGQSAQIPGEIKEDKQWQVVPAEAIDNLLMPKGFRYMPVSAIKPGYLIRGYLVSHLVVSVELTEDGYIITYIDGDDHKTKKQKANKNDEFTVMPKDTSGMN